MADMPTDVKNRRSLPQRRDGNQKSCGPLQFATELRSDQVGRVAEVFAALGDPVRLRIYWMIAATDEICSCSLEAPLGRSQSTVSHHTSKLAQAGLIEGERRGRWTWWRVVPSVAEEFGLRGILDPSH